MNLSDDDNVDPQEEVPTSTGGEAKFAAVEVKSGEEQYNVLLSLTKCKLMRFAEGENKGKERGQGDNLVRGGGLLRRPRRHPRIVPHQLPHKRSRGTIQIGFRCRRRSTLN